MSRQQTKARLLSVIATDATFEQVSWRGDVVWEGKCLHCRRKHHLTLDGTPISRATLEHIVPQTHGGTNDVHNLAIACARCTRRFSRPRRIVSAQWIALQRVSIAVATRCASGLRTCSHLRNSIGSSP